MIRIRTQARGVNRTINRIQRHRARANRCIGANAPFIRRLMLAIVRFNFASESDDGRPWPPLSPDYAARKRGPQILIETGRMFRSLVGRTGDAIYRVAPLRLVYGTRVPYAKYHQHYNIGTVIPSRPFMPRPDRLVRPIATRLRGYIRG